MVDWQAFKIVGIDTFTKPGICVLTCEKDVISPDDDLENNIAGGLACKVEITNPKPIEVYLGQTVQLTWNSNNAPVLFTSSDDNIATVDAQGLITGVGIGQATITVQNATNGLIRDSVTVEVLEEPASYWIQITSTSSPPDEIKSGQSKTYTAQVYNGTTLLTNEPVIWQLFADDQVSSTTLATITSQNGTSCTVKANSNHQYGYVQFKCVLADNADVYTWHRIKISSLI